MKKISVLVPFLWKEWYLKCTIKIVVFVVFEEGRTYEKLRWIKQ